MGDVRYDRAYESILRSRDRARTLAALDDVEVVQALGAASRAHDALLANVLATEAMNRMQRAVAIARHMAEGALACDAEGRCTFANASAAALLGSPVETLVGQDLASILEIEGIRSSSDPIIRTLASGGTSRLDGHALITAAGRALPVALTYAPIVSEGETTGCVVTFRDVTHERAAQNALHEANAFLQASIDALPVTVAIVDADGRIVAVNGTWRAFGAQNGLTWSDHGVGRDYAAFCVGSEDAEAFAQALGDVLAGRRDAYEIEYPCHSPTSRRWFIGRITRLVWDGPPHALVSHLDITRRKLAEIKAADVATSKDWNAPS